MAEKRKDATRLRRQFAIRLSQEELEEFRRFCNSEDITMGYALRKAILAMVEEERIPG